MTLILVGLIVSFFGAIILIIESFHNIKKPTYIIFPVYGKKNKVVGYHREKKIKEGYKEVKILREEITLIFAFSLLGLGFFLQILGHFL